MAGALLLAGFSNVWRTPSATGKLPSGELGLLGRRLSLASLSGADVEVRLAVALGGVALASAAVGVAWSSLLFSAAVGGASSSGMLISGVGWAGTVELARAED